MATIKEQIKQEFLEVLEDKRVTLMELGLPVECDQLTLAMAVAVHFYRLLQVAEHPFLE